jgi:hypothetical protein
VKESRPTVYSADTEVFEFENEWREAILYRYENNVHTSAPDESFPIFGSEL